MKDCQDAFGHALYNYLKNKEGLYDFERDDGQMAEGCEAKQYFAQYRQWPAHQKKAMKHVRGRALDIGCGAGKHALYLQKKGFDVLGTDESPLAIRVCKLRGLRKARVLSITKISARIGKFNTLLMLGNNFGLFGNPRRAKWLLKRFRGITYDDGKIIAEVRDPYMTKNPINLDYHRLNIKRKRMAGQVRGRVRYRKYVTPWFDYLFVSKDEMRQILKGTGWTITRFIKSEGPVYIAIIEKEESS